MAERDEPTLPDQSSQIIDPFEQFASLPFYIQVNQGLVSSVGLKPGQIVIDSGCGPGNISKLIAPLIEDDGKIFAVDISRRALVAARKNLSSLQTTFHFIQTTAEKVAEILDGLRGKVDAIVCGNAIHNFADKESVVGGASRLLRKDGIFAFNTTFFDGCIPANQEDFYKSWVFKALRSATYILKNDASLSRLEKGGKSEARKQLAPEEYSDLVKNFGFTIKSRSVHAVNMPPEAFKAISVDDEFAQGTLGRFPLNVAKEALKTAVEEVFREKGMLFSPRNWLQIIAVKV